MPIDLGLATMLFSVIVTQYTYFVPAIDIDLLHLVSYSSSKPCHSMRVFQLSPLDRRLFGILRDGHEASVGPQGTEDRRARRNCT